MHSPPFAITNQEGERVAEDTKTKLFCRSLHQINKQTKNMVQNLRTKNDPAIINKEKSNLY